MNDMRYECKLILITAFSLINIFVIPLVYVGQALVTEPLD
jgi:hypothetical protein